jgi:N-acetylglucosamine kinase-like BadF-type ATPase
VSVADGRWALGLDGGNTKTLAVVGVAGPDGRTEVRGVGRAGCADIYGAGSPAAALEQMESAVGKALHEAGIGAHDLGAAAFSLAGADWPEDFVLLERELLARLGLRETPIVVNDSLGALRSGSPDWSGVSVVAGTYNAIGARRADGHLFHIGFWPDGAGGRDLARDGLKAVYRAELDLGPETALVGRALARYGVDDGIALLHEFTRRGGLQIVDQDAFAPDVLEAADAGDPVAYELVTAKGRMLGAQARVCAERADLPLDGARVVLTGRVMEHPSPLLARCVMAELPGAVEVRHGAPPVLGALLLAFDRLGVAADADAAALAAALDPERRSPRWVGSPSKA